MSPQRGHPLGSPALRLAAFGALAALAGAQWMRLVEEPPAGRVALAVIALTGGAAVVALIASARPRRVAAVAGASIVAILAIALGLLAIGFPAHLLQPGGWGELADRIGRGFSGLTGDIAYPYRGGNEWSRLVILAGLPVAVGVAAALAFWPGGRSAVVRRTAPLVVLAGTFAVASTVVAPEQPLVWGLGLLGAIGAWLWLPALGRRDAIAGGALVAVAGVLALPLAGALDHDEPWIDFREWELGRADPTTFDWNHSYGPLDWPREGTALAGMETRDPHYWKTAVLGEFDGVAWRRSEQTFGDRLELPTEVEGESGAIGFAAPNARWLEQIGVTIGPMETEFVLGAGSLISVDGLENVLSRPDGTTVTDGEPLEEGDSYSISAYVPDPRVARLRAAPDRYERSLARYTQLTIPSRSAESDEAIPAPEETVQIPLRGASRPAGDRAARRTIAASPYADTYRLAARLTRGEPTAYDAVRSIERHFQSGFTYTEDPQSARYPLASFLFEDRFGYCQQFSGAMALMLRMSGIPSRVVSGFSPGSIDPDDNDRYLVEDLDAHSWVEAYFPTIGWVTFDPTPASAPAAGRPAAGALTGGGLALDEGGQAQNRRKGFTPPRTRPETAAPSSGGLPTWTVPGAVALVVLVGLAVVTASAAVRRRRYLRLPAGARADAHLRELPAALGRLGWPVKTNETLLALEHRLATYRKRAAARYVAQLRMTRFASTASDVPTLGARRALRDDLSSRGGLRARIRGLLALPPGGPAS
jgi:protein-glutamine gamma-glutamyltransferase